jgi:hypothetical protein
MSPAHKTRKYTPAGPHQCWICCGAIPAVNKYCPRCMFHIFKLPDTLAHVRALKAAWDPIVKGFRCYYTGVLLEEKDLSSPWYITFDHRTPGKKGDLVVCAAWVNSMKTQLSEEEFGAIIIELARCREAGEPFNMAVAEFKYWRAPARLKPGKLASLTDMRLPKVGDCIICSARTYPYSPFCPTCRRAIQQRNNHKERAAAMQASWDPVRKAFICYLTGLELERLNNRSPIFLTFDHRIPNQAGTVKVATAFVNYMKTALSEDEFWLVVKELAHHFQTGETFNKDIIKFAYWKRWVIAQKRAMMARRLAARARRK